MKAIDTKIYKNSPYGVLRDLIEHKKQDDSIFHTYKDKAEIGKEIFKELYSRFQQEGDQKGFYMDDSEQIGILSQCHSLQALLLLASEFGLKFDDTNLLGGNETNMSIRDIMDTVIDDIIKRIDPEERKKAFDRRRGRRNTVLDAEGYIFDASPYDTGDNFTVQYSNIEAITWIIPCFLQTLKYHAVNNETCKWEEKLVDVIKYGLDYLNKAYITSKEVGTSKKLQVGWNFTKDCQEPSLYYSFAVCECFVDFYETFGDDKSCDFLTYLEALRNENDHPNAIDLHPSEEIRTRFEKEQENFEKDSVKEKRNVGKNESGKEIAPHTPYNELRCRFLEINDGVGTLLKNSTYLEFESHCKELAREVWRLSKENLADKFYYNDLETTLTEEDISMATTSDALFNTVYIINIMLDVGLDEELEVERISNHSDAEAHEQTDPVAAAEYALKATEASREYNNLFESCQVASQMAFRTYEKLKAKGKEYIVDQFLVGFNENFTTHADRVRELRKLRMRVFTLTPLLIRTNNVISEYLIKYPQANMKKYLAYILENRYEETRKDGLKYRWIWENDGFFSCSNYYYVSALGEFYRYYEKYESQFIQSYNNNKAAEKRIRVDYLAELKKPDQEIGKLEEAKRVKDETISVLEAELKAKNDAIADLQYRLDNVPKPVEDAVTKVVVETIEKRLAKDIEAMLPEILCSFINNAAAGISAEEVNDTPATAEQENFAGAMVNLVSAMLSKTVYKKAHDKNASAEENVKRFNTLNGKVKKEFMRCVKQFISNVKDSREGRSGLLDD